MSLVLVTGGCGFLGRRTIRSLAASGYSQIRCLVRPGTPAHAFRLIVEEFPGLRIEQFPVSFNDKRALARAVQGVDILYHLAASRQGSAAAMVANTVVGSDNLYQASVSASVARFVLVSSMSVMAMAKVLRAAIVDEKVPMDEHPERRDPYSFSKHRQEALAWKYADAGGLPLVVVRPGVIFGPGCDILHTRIGLNVLGVFLHLGGGNPVPLTYVDNCADAVVLAGSVPNLNREVFCIVDDEIPTSRYLLRRYCREGGRLHILPVPRLLLAPISNLNTWYTRKTKGHLPVLFNLDEIASLWRGQQFSNAKAKKFLNWNPRVSMKDALDSTFSFLRDNWKKRASR